jgi:tRNA nucleotidyltransferase (CCA-adding enzyme)
MEFLDELRVKFRPSEKEIASITADTKVIIKKLGAVKGAKAVLGGSGAKGTWIHGAIDVDIFVCYDYKKFSSKSSELSELLYPVLKKLFGRVSRIHGSRDYFQLQKGGITFEIVPILAVKKASDARNITDVSPLHALWVKKNVKNHDDVRLLKAFCKAHEIYGAESHIKGFSGYVCEILIAKYKNFPNVLKAALKWKNTVIDVENHYKRGIDAFHALNQSKLSPLIVIDPVQKERNASAALSTESLAKFVSSAKEFLKKPSEKFFETKSFDLKKLKNAVVIEAIPLFGKEDIVASKLLKASGYIKQQLEMADFKIKNSDWLWNPEKSVLWYSFESIQIPKEKVVAGPPKGNLFHEERFKKAHKTAFLKNGRLYAKISREFIDARKLAQKLVKDAYVKE